MVWNTCVLHLWSRILRKFRLIPRLSVLRRMKVTRYNFIDCFRPPDIPEILWFEEENDLIRSCAALSSALGLQKSFSTSDISQLPSPDETPLNLVTRSAVSELALTCAQRSGYLIDHPRLEHASRSCSTWVAVGDVASTSQLPSPHGGHTTATAPPPTPPSFTAADLIRSVNKKVTYKVSVWNHCI